MGVFHCPMGAVGMDAENCIHCGMCQARTKTEQRAAADKVREHLRQSADTRLSKYLIKKIAVCGKGGVGKSTITGMMAMALRDMGYEVLVIDTDESNEGLSRKLGFSGQPKPLMAFLEQLPEEELPRAEWLTNEKIRFEDIPEEFLLSRNRLHFMMAGKIEDALQGCACSLTDVVKILLSKLETEAKQIVIVDIEAGVESFGRGVERYTDTIIMVVEPSYESIQMAKTIRYMAEGMGILRIRAILNKVGSPKAGEITIKQLLEDNIKYLGVMYMDEDISEAGLLGQTVTECEAKENIENIIRLMLDESEMEYNQI